MRTLLTLALIAVSVGWYVDHKSQVGVISAGHIPTVEDIQRDNEYIARLCHAKFGVPYPDRGNEPVTRAWEHAFECATDMKAERWSMETMEWGKQVDYFDMRNPVLDGYNEVTNSTTGIK